MYKALLILSLAYLFIGCDDDGSSSSSYFADNKWIYTQMKGVYYWSDNIPSNPNYNQKSESFFESLLNKPEDRFSWIQNATDLENSLNGISVSPGFETRLYLKLAGSDEVLAQIVYVFPNSPASKAGLVRGDLFTKVNGVTITTSNYVNLLFSGSSSSMNLYLVVPSNYGFEYSKQVVVQPDLFVENPIMKDSVYDFNGVKVGYFAYKNFIPDPGDNTMSYDEEIDRIFSKFKSAGISSLVLDLRFNTGGAVTSCVKLSSLLVENATSADVFIKTQYNKLVTEQIIKEFGSDFFVTKFTDEPNNVSKSLNKLVVLTSNMTASESELLIYCLRPYMDVITIGSTTYGKNVGSISITDETNKVKWGLQPIVVKMHNKNGLSDYTNGILADYPLDDNSLEIFPLGDVNEVLFRKALEDVISVSGIQYAKSLKSVQSIDLGDEVSNSLVHKPNVFNLSVDR